MLVSGACRGSWGYGSAMLCMDRAIRLIVNGVRAEGMRLLGGGGVRWRCAGGLRGLAWSGARNW